MNNTVLISHPGKQHFFKLAKSLQELNYLQTFITSVYYKPDHFPYTLSKYLPLKRYSRYLDKLVERTESRLPVERVIDFPYLEIFRVIINSSVNRFNDYLIYLRNLCHDQYVSKKIYKLKPEIVIGSESACARTFSAAKRIGAITVLDVASVHYKYLELLSNKYKTFKDAFADNYINRKTNILKSREYNLSDYIITLSNYSKSTFIDFGLDSDKIFVLNPGFDPEIFTPKSDYKKAGLFKILYVGQINARKGLYTLIKVFNELDLPESELVLIGDAAGDINLKNMTNKKTTHYSFMSHQLLVNHYKDADIFVLPSYSDGWGMVVMESMACGTPVIVTDNTGSKDAVQDGKNGFVINVENPDQLKEKIKFFYDNRNKVKEFGTNSMAKAKEYSWDNYRSRLENIILQIYNK